MKYRFTFLTSVFVLFASSDALGQDQGHILAQLTAVMSFVEILAFVSGLFLFGFGVYGVYKASASPNQNSYSSSFKYVLSGTLLLSIITTYGIIVRTTVNEQWNESARSVLALNERALENFSGTSTNTVLGAMMPASLGVVMLGIIYLIGFISFIRGLYLIKDIGGNSQNAAGLGKVLTHIIGGVVCMNLTRTSCLLANSFTTNTPSFC